MKNKVLSGLVLTSIIVSGLYATNPNGNCKENFKNTNFKEKRVSNRYKHKMPVLKMVKKLDLTDKQKEKIQNILMENKKNRISVSDTFTKTNFDKEAYIKIMNEKRENMIKSKADLIEKVYLVLDSKQKEQLKNLMNIKKDKKQTFYNKKLNM